jgi:hypothetical protein
MGRLAPILLTILIAGGAGFALGRSLSSLDARIAASSAQTVGCKAHVEETWMEGESGAYRAMAHAFGERCSAAVAVVALLDPGGAPIWSEAHPAAEIFGLADAANAKAMEAALRDWIPNHDAMMNNTAKLPAWPEGAVAPAAGEFPFYPEPGMDRAAYEGWKAKAVPLFCYAQGRESLACLAFDGERLEKIGVQAFPG